MRRSIQEIDITRLFGDLSGLARYAGESRVNYVARNGSFEIPARGTGRHSVPNAVGRILFERRTPGTSKQDRINWNLANRDPHQR